MWTGVHNVSLSSPFGKYTKMRAEGWGAFKRSERRKTKAYESDEGQREDGSV